MSKRRPKPEWLTKRYLLSVFRYDAVNGELIWLPKPNLFASDRAWNTKFAGVKAGCADKYGYLQVSIRGGTFFVHLLIWFLCTGEWPKLDIDHKNRVKER